VHPSNPHHVLEVHPAWGFTAPGSSFDRKDLVTAIANYRGYGLAKYKKVLNEAGDWLKAYQDADHLYVQLQDASNFFQLPVAVTGRQSITGGTEFTFDVYSSKQFGTVVYQGLRGVSVTGSVLGAPLILQSLTHAEPASREGAAC
jgi:hypothetical protein